MGGREGMRGSEVGRVKGRDGGTEGERGGTEDAGMRFLRGTAEIQWFVNPIFVFLICWW